MFPGPEKFDNCPICGGYLDQSEYEFQYCAECDTDVGFSHFPKRDRTVLPHYGRRVSAPPVSGGSFRRHEGEIDAD